MRPFALALTIAVALVAPTIGAPHERGGHHKVRGAAWSYDQGRDPCGDSGVQCLFQTQHRKLATPAAQVVLETKQLTIDNAGMIHLHYSIDTSDHQNEDWIGIYCVEDDAPPLDDTQYMDYFWANKTEDTVEFGPMVNMRCSWQFRYFRTLAPDTFEKLGETDQVVRMSGGHTEPLQVHTALTGTPTELTVMWTSASVQKPGVWYGLDPNKLDRFASATATTYQANDMCHEPATREDARWFRDPGVKYSAVLTGLIPEGSVFYRVGDASKQPQLRQQRQRGNDDKRVSNVFQAKLPPAPGQQDKPASFFMYGDLGDYYQKAAHTPAAERMATTLELMQEDMNNDAFNFVAVMHDGDISYGMGRTYIWDQFGTMVEPVASRLPYMVGVGNHEYVYDRGGAKDPSGARDMSFHPSEGNYKNESNGECGVPLDKRFVMPNNGNRVFWWSVEMGLVHHTMVSSEHDYTAESPMFEWLERDLAQVDRRKTPWLLLHLHRPMYCSEDYKSDYKMSLFIRQHLEPLLAKYRVDAVFAGHYHAFERTCPVYKEDCRIEPLPNGLEKAKAPVHFMVGSGGADVDNAKYLNVSWSRAAEMTYGYSRVHVHNRTHMHFEFVRNHDRKVSDSAWVISDHDWEV